MQVRPAKREGTFRTIFQRPLNPSDLKPGAAGLLIVSVDADGIYADGSKYRYLLEFTLDELRSVVNGAAADIIYATAQRDGGQPMQGSSGRTGSPQ
jgi:hypothetical protein